MDDPRRAAGASARAAPDGPARRRQICDQRPQRPLSQGHQPQQQAQKADRARRARHHRPQREEDAPRGCRRPDRERQARQGGQRSRQQRAQIAHRVAQRQAGTFPSELAGQARRLFRTFGHRRRTGAQNVSMRHPQGDGAGAVQALCDEKARRHGQVQQHQERQARDREGAGRRRLGHPRGRHQGSSCAAQPCSDTAQTRHPGV